MTALPAGPDPAQLVTDDAVAAARAVFVSGGGGVRAMLEAAAFPIVAAWQRWEEEMLPDDGK